MNPLFGKFPVKTQSRENILKASGRGFYEAIRETLSQPLPNVQAINGRVTHSKQFIGLVIETAATGNIRDFVDRFLQLPPMYTQTPAGLAALAFEAYLIDHDREMYMQFVETVVNPKHQDFLVVLEGEIKPEQLDRLEKGVSQLCTIKPLVVHGQRSPALQEVADLTVLQAVPIGKPKLFEPVKPAHEAGPETKHEFKDGKLNTKIEEGVFGSEDGHPNNTPSGFLLRREKHGTYKVTTATPHKLSWSHGDSYKNLGTHADMNAVHAAADAHHASLQPVALKPATQARLKAVSTMRDIHGMFPGSREKLAARLKGERSNAWHSSESFNPAAYNVWEFNLKKGQRVFCESQEAIVTDVTETEVTITTLNDSIKLPRFGSAEWTPEHALIDANVNEVGPFKPLTPAERKEGYDIYQQSQYLAPSANPGNPYHDTLTKHGFHVSNVDNNPPHTMHHYKKGDAVVLVHNQNRNWQWRAHRRVGAKQYSGAESRTLDSFLRKPHRPARDESFQLTETVNNTIQSIYQTWAVTRNSDNIIVRIGDSQAVVDPSMPDVIAEVLDLDLHYQDSLVEGDTIIQAGLKEVVESGTDQHDTAKSLAKNTRKTHYFSWQDKNYPVATSPRSMDEIHHRVHPNGDVEVYLPNFKKYYGTEQESVASTQPSPWQPIIESVEQKQLRERLANYAAMELVAKINEELKPSTKQLLKSAKWNKSKAGLGATPFTRYGVARAVRATRGSRNRTYESAKPKEPKKDETPVKWRSSGTNENGQPVHRHTSASGVYEMMWHKTINRQPSYAVTFRNKDGVAAHIGNFHDVKKATNEVKMHQNAVMNFPKMHQPQEALTA